MADRVDVCPHLPDPGQEDQDSDGVGDACDRDPTQAGQRLAYFNAMRPEDEDVGLTGAGAWTQLADSVAYDGDPGGSFGNGQMTKVMPLGDADVWMGVSVQTRLPGAPDSQVVLALVDVTSANPYYFAGLYQDGNGTNISVSEWTGTAYRTRGTQAVPGDLHTGELDVFIAARLFPRQLDVIGGWPGESYNTAALLPNYDGVDRVVLATEGLALEVRYLAIVTTP